LWSLLWLVVVLALAGVVEVASFALVVVVVVSCTCSGCALVVVFCSHCVPAVVVKAVIVDWCHGCACDRCWCWLPQMPLRSLSKLLWLLLELLSVALAVVVGHLWPLSRLRL